MTPPRRTEVRNAFVAALAGLATTGARVFASRTRPLEAAELPAILVFSGEASPGASLLGGRIVTNRYRLRADILVRDGINSENIADKVLEEMQAALFATPAAMTLGGQVKTLQWVGSGDPELDDSTEKPAIRVPVLYEVVYT